MALDAGIGSATANSYLTLAVANDYFATRWDTAAWDALTDPQKEKALMAATRIVDRETFIETPATTTQRLKWPRLYIRKVDASFYYGANGSICYYTAQELPQQLKDAVCEMAFNLAAGTNTETAGRKIASWSSDDQSFTYEADGRSASALPAEVMQLLSPFLRGNRLVRS